MPRDFLDLRAEALVRDACDVRDVRERWMDRGGLASDISGSFMKYSKGRFCAIPHERAVPKRG